MTKKKEMIIIVPGIKVLKKWPVPVSKLILFLAGRFHLFKPVYYEYTKNWAEKMRVKGKKVILLHWSRNLGIFDNLSAERKLAKLIAKYHKKYNINVVGISMGGKIAWDITKKFSDREIKKLILIAAVGIPNKVSLDGIKLVNFYSDADKIAKFASEIIRPFDGTLKILGKNIKNIKFNFDHIDFCVGSKILSGSFVGKNFVDVVEKYVR